MKKSTVRIPMLFEEKSCFVKRKTMYKSKKNPIAEGMFNAKESGTPTFSRRPTNA